MYFNRLVRPACKPPAGISVAFYRLGNRDDSNNEERAVLYMIGATESLRDEIRPDQASRDQTCSLARARSLQNYEENSWRALYPPAALLLFLFLAGSAWTAWNFGGRETSDWQPTLERGHAARERGDLHYARSLYTQVGRLSAQRDDWAGLLAAACGMKKLERQRGRRSETNALLLKAMNAAKTRQSQSGLVAVASAFSALGHDSVASMVLSHARQDWVEPTTNSPDVAWLDCWER